MNGLLLDGKKISREIQEELRPRIEALQAQSKTPGLAVVLVGENPASQIYVRNKVKASQDLGIRSLEFTPPGDITTPHLIQLLQPLKTDPSIHGILIQMPLPEQIDAEQLVSQIVDPVHDVDGFGSNSLGLLVRNKPGPRACTPAGIMELLRRYEIPIAGKHAVVVGRSDIVGKPMGLMLLHQNATVTICHSRTRNLGEECRRADILVAAIGRPATITREYIKPGAVVIDVGMNRLTSEADVQRIFGHDPGRLAAFARNGSTLVGDVDPLAMQELSSAYTPVPGGVGPLTIAMLMSNTVGLADGAIWRN
jgi:methylenetetrahydrofolate dehydrogenase (NADP+) / methenyltetrahydrofolate cyclohydrolase